MASGMSDAFYGLWDSAQNDVWAIGFNNFCHWDGSMWTSTPTNANTELTDIWGSGPDDVWVAGVLNVRHWNGTSWSVVGHNPQIMVGIWGTGPNGIWSAGHTGVVLHWDGTGWNRVQVGTSQKLHDFWGTGAGDVRVVGENGTIMRMP